MVAAAQGAELQPPAARVGVGVDVEVLAGPRPQRRTLLDGIDLVLTERRVVVIGANGSGKSTLLRLLNGLVAPTRGTVRVDGLDTVRDGRAVRRRVGFVFTDPLAQLVMSTPVEDLELSLRRTVGDRRERTRRALALLEAFLRHPERALSKSLLLDTVWGAEFLGDDNIVEVYVRQLRRALGEPELIHTLRGAGYALRLRP